MSNQFIRGCDEVYKYNMSALSQLFEENFVKEAITEFVRKVYLLLENPQFHESVCWDADDRTMVIRDPEKLLVEVLGVVFKQKTLKSFIRQLNMYNFKKIKNGKNPEHLYFRNTHFVRGNIQQLIFIKRKQRGYVEKSKLENLESRTLLEKYRIFTNGIMAKLKTQVSQLMDTYPKICTDLLGLMRSSYVPPLHQTENENPIRTGTDESLNRLGQEKIGSMFESMRSFYQLPLEFRSDLSSLGEFEENSFSS